MSDPISAPILLTILSRWTPRDIHQSAAIENLIPYDTVAICNDGEVKIYSYLVSRRSNIKDFPIRMEVPIAKARAFFDYVQYGLLQPLSGYTYVGDLYNLAVKYGVPMLARILRYQDLKGFDPKLDKLIQQYENGNSEYMHVQDEHLVSKIAHSFGRYTFAKTDDLGRLMLTIEKNPPIKFLVDIPDEVKRKAAEYVKNQTTRRQPQI